jgi:HK97 family phage major capsid protein
MFVITKRLVEHLVTDLSLDAKHLDPATRNDDEVRQFVMKAMVTDGTLSTEKLAELTKEEKSAAHAVVSKLVEDAVSKQFDGLREEIRKAFVPAAGTDGASTQPVSTKAHDLGAGAPSQPTEADKAYAAGAAAAVGDGSGNGGDRITHKSILERFDDTRRGLTYADSSNPYLAKAFGNKPVVTGISASTWSDVPGRELNHPTDRQKAVAGVWFKSLVAQAYMNGGRPVPGAFRLNELDRKLLEAAIHECQFVGPVNHQDEDREDAEYWHKGGRVPEYLRKKMLTKALLDDVTSGGLEAVPIEFDDLAVMSAVLEGELFPLVSQRTVTRRRIEGFSIGEPTFEWVAEGTAATPFNTDGFIAALDTTIYPVVGSIEVGLDFEADSPVDMGDLILVRYGQKFRQLMDNVLATGNGSSQPLGVFNTAALTTVPTANGFTGPHDLGDYEGLLFGVAKQYRTEAGRARSVYISNEASYRRSRSMPVDSSGSSTDERRLFGLAHEDYNTLGHPHKINESLTNSQGGFFCMNRYRFYRRAGYSVRVVTESRELALKNQQLIMVRARVGGQLEIAAAGAKSVDFQS